MYLPGQVLRQFGKVQVTPVVTAYFSHVSRELSDWGVCIQPHVASVEFDSLQPLLWGWGRGAEDLGTTPEYDAWFARHRPIPLTDPTVPIIAQQICHPRQRLRIDAGERARGGGEVGAKGGGEGDEGEDVDIGGDTKLTMFVVSFVIHQLNWRCKTFHR